MRLQRDHDRQQRNGRRTACLRRRRRPNAATVHIYNVNGAIVKTLFLPSGDHVQPLADGMYLVRVGEQVRKILVK
ncbi:T9SS C-terminal target domain-containing protein [Tannerella forsythia]|uniref:T9SS C-terminal target domain-containing protein n=1 Tax=Tannerella forsythia TaxID=28112 RepID=A0A3P1YGB0_TANFO|nr:T9SS C-terminal target domain-containing protein [Tannerella forsythia]